MNGIFFLEKHFLKDMETFNVILGGENRKKKKKDKKIQSTATNHVRFYCLLSTYIRIMVNITITVN